MSIYASIIILTKNAGERLDSVLKAVCACAEKNNSEIIVIDSGSTDNTKEIISRYPVERIDIHPLSFSHGGTRNLGARYAKGEVLVFLTQDALPADANWLIFLIDNLKLPGVAGVFGRQIPDKNSSPIENFFTLYLYPEYKIVKESINPDDCLLSEIFFSNVNSAIWKSEWEDNKFNENMIMSEDQDWSKRILIKGKKIIYEPRAAVFHSHRYKARELIQRNFDSGMSLKGIVNASFRRSLDYQINYLKEGILFLVNKKNYHYALLFLFYEAVRSFAFFLGFHSKYLPLSFKKRISLHKSYWMRGMQKG